MNNSSIVDNGNIAGEWITNDPLPKTVRIALAVFLIVSFIAGTVGNITVLALFIRYRTLRTKSNIFVVNMIVADLLICLVCLPNLINVYLRGRKDHAIDRFICNFDAFLGAFTGFLSIWSLVCLSVDRCIVITRHMPIRNTSNKSAVAYTICAVWTLAFVGAGLPYVGFGRFVFKGVTMSCGSLDIFATTRSNIIYNVLIQVVFFLIPIICIISCYTHIFKKVRDHERLYFDAKRVGHTEPALRRTCNRRSIERNEMKTAKAGLILFAIFCFSWAPYSIVSWVGLFSDRDLSPLAVVFPGLFAKVSTILNPLFYALLLQSFKSKLSLCCKSLLKTSSSSSSPSQRSTFNHLLVPKPEPLRTRENSSTV